MKKLSHFFATLFILIVPTTAFNQVTSDSFQTDKALLSQKPVLFQENRGQVVDIKGNTVPSVLFKASAKGVDAYITTKGLVYVFSGSSKQSDAASVQAGISESETVEMEWLQVHLEGADIRQENVVKEFPGETDYRFFLGHCPDGIFGVKEYEKITIKNVYPGIDWVLYGSSEKGMKYDFIVCPGANPDQIRLVYESENLAQLDDTGNIRVQLRSGFIIEKAPESFVGDHKVYSSFKSEELDKNRVRVSYEIGDYDKEEILRIDPELVWGTLFGSSAGGTIIENMAHDNFNNLFACGWTGAIGFPSLNAGTYFETNPVTLFRSPFIAKFDGKGKLLWSTIYGFGYSYDLACDGNNNVFLIGITNGLMNNGGPFPLQDNGTYFQPYTMSYDGNIFIVKFDNAGNRKWATLYGGSDGDIVEAITCDLNNNIFIIGSTSSPDFPLQNSGTYFEPSSSSQHQYILKFDNAGNRLWATCYGGGSSRFQSLVCDATGNLFIAGNTLATDFPVQDAGTYFDGTLGGSGDMLIIKFDNSGNRLWGTFYGGIDGEEATTIITDLDGNIFVSGVTLSDSLSDNFPVLDAGTYFQHYGGGQTDAFILKFDNTGNLLWATCYGGTEVEITHGYFGVEGQNLGIDDCGNVYMVLLSNSDDIPMKDAGGNSHFDPVFSSGHPAMQDIFITEFSNSGELLWATYFEGPAPVNGVVLEVDKSNHLILGGFWSWPSANDPLFVNPGNGAYFDTTFYYEPGQQLEFKYTNGYLYKFAPEPVTAVQNGFQTATDCGCIGTTTVDVTEGIPPFTFSWSDGTQTANTLSATNSNLCYGNQWVVVANCNTSDTVFFDIAADCHLPEIIAPNILVLSSKEGNNQFFVKTTSITDFNCVIVNRWGNLIYEYNDKGGSWNGTSKGDPVSEGVYFYHITATAENGDQLSREGFVHVYY